MNEPNRENIQQIRERVIQMARRINELAQSNVEPAFFFREFINLLTGALGARAGAVWMRGPNGQVNLAAEVKLSETGFFENPEAKPRNDRFLSEVFSTGEAIAYSPEDENGDPGRQLPTNHMVIMAGLQTGKEIVGAVEIFQRADAPKEAKPGYLQFVEQMSALASQYIERQHRTQTAVTPDEFWQNFERFLLELNSSLDMKETAWTAANDGRLLLEVDRVSVAIRRGRKTDIKAISGQDSVNPRANLVRTMAKLCDKVIAMREPLAYTGRVEHLPPQIEKPLADYIQESGSRMVIIAPLFESQPLAKEEDKQERKKRQEQTGKVVGAYVVEKVAESRPEPEMEKKIDLIVDHVAAAICNARNHHRIFGLTVWKFLGRQTEWFHGRKLAKTLGLFALVGAVVAAMAFVPWDYRVEGEGKQMPVIQRDVFAPLNGTVKIVYVRGGKRVDKGDRLLQLENEELRSQLIAQRNELAEKRQLESSLEAEIDEAVRIADRREETRLKGRLAEARTQIIGLEAQVQLLEEREKKLLVVSPIDGVVATFQVQQLLQNRPVQEGEVLLQVMDDTGEWQLELEVEEQRMGHIFRGRDKLKTDELPVEYLLATNPEITYEGELQEIGTRTHTDEEKGAVVEVVVEILDDPQAQARSLSRRQDDIQSKLRQAIASNENGEVDEELVQLLDQEQAQIQRDIDRLKVGSEKERKAKSAAVTAAEDTHRFLAGLDLEQAISAANRSAGELEELAKEMGKNKRIGAEVQGKINCGKRSLGYVLFGDVVEFIQKHLWL